MVRGIILVWNNFGYEMLASIHNFCVQTLEEGNNALFLLLPYVLFLYKDLAVLQDHIDRGLPVEIETSC